MNRVEPRAPGLRELATYLAARVVPALVSMALTFVCIHALSAEAYGTYSLTLLPASVAAGLIGGLSGQAMLRYGHELSAAGLRRGLLGFPLAASALICPLVLAYLTWSVGLHEGALLSVVSVPLVALMDTRRSYFVARAQADSVFMMDVLRAVAALGLVWLLIAAWGGRAAAPLLAQVLAVGLALAVVRPKPDRGSMEPRALPPIPMPTPLRAVDRQYVTYGLWFAGWMAVASGLALAERSIVEAASGIAASGRYAAQADVVNAIFAAAGGALGSSMMPSYLALADAGGNAGGGHSAAATGHAVTMRRLLRIGLAGCVATALVCVGLGALLYRIGSGRIASALTGDVPTALMLVAAATVWTAAGFVQKPLELGGRTRSTFAAAFIALLLFLLIAPFMARWFGPVGVGLAKLVAGLGFVLTANRLASRLAARVAA